MVLLGCLCFPEGCGRGCRVTCREVGSQNFTSKGECFNRLDVQLTLPEAVGNRRAVKSGGARRNEALFD